MSIARLRAAAIALIACSACDPVGEFTDVFFAESPREAYIHRLQTAGLAESAAVRDWLAAGRRAVATAPLVALPYEEAGYLASTETGAVAVRFDAERGERLSIDIAFAPDTTALVFIDVFRVPADSNETAELLASADSAARSLELEPNRTGQYVLRVQPELLRGGRYTVRITTDAALAFPVADSDAGDIGSVFGDARDGGARDHHGIDIFAARGTPVLATSAAHVRRVGETPRGGKVVWLRDEARGISVYYAHLDAHLVTDGMRVDVGDTLGLVGNTGNASTTPPHLHFGIYSRGEGPIDPLPFVHQPHRPLSVLAVDTSAFGKWLRGARDGVRLRAAPDDDAPIIAELPRFTALRVYGASGSWYRVRLPDGRAGFIAGSVVQVASAPVESSTAEVAIALQERPMVGAVVVDSVPAGEGVDVFGRFGDYLLVQANDGPRGWMRGPLY